MPKLVLNDLSSLTNEISAVAALNANYLLIENALENTLSLDGTSPNSMSADLDMDSNRITNLPEPVSAQEVATKAYVDSVAGVDIGDITSYVTDAETAATAAEAAQTAAEAAAAKLTGTSTTSIGIGTGTKTFTTQASKFFDAGTFVLITSDADETNYMSGQVTSYSSTTLEVDVTGTGGTGTLSDWTIRVAGAVGPEGSASYTTLDIAGASAMTDVTVTDSIPVYDASTTTNKRATYQEFFDGIGQLTAETAVATGDSVVLYDTSASTGDRATVEEVFKVINNFTADSTPVQSTDYTVTYDASASGPKKVLLNKVGVGRQTIALPAGSWMPNASNGCAALAQLDATNGLNYKYLAFDATSIEYASCFIPTPKGWDAGNIYFRTIWTHPATTTNFGVAWTLYVRSIGDGEALGTAHSPSATVTDTGGTTNSMYITAEGSAIPPGGATKRDWLHLLLNRDPTNGADNLAVDAYLLGVELYYTTDTNTDD